MSWVTYRMVQNAVMNWTAEDIRIYRSKDDAMLAREYDGTLTVQYAKKVMYAPVDSATEQYLKKLRAEARKRKT
jgi:hypothetical protein